MEIFNDHHKKGFLSKVKNKITSRRIFIIFIVLIGLAGFGFGSILYGAYLNQTGQTSMIKMFLIRTSQLDFNYIPNHAKSKVAEIDNLTIDIKFKNWQKIKYIRENALLYTGIDKQPREEVPAKIRYNNKTYRAKIGITGQTNEHIKHPYKWSLLVKLKDGETIKGVNKFALLFPQARGYLTDWIAFELLKSQNIIGIKTDFVDVVLNGNDFGLYYFEERFGNNLLVNNKRVDGLIFKLDGDLKVYEPNKVLNNKELSTQLIALKKLLHLFLTDKVKVEEIFDIKKFSALFVVSDILNQKHALFRGNSRLYFNPVTKLIEPIGREWGYLRDGASAPMSLAIEEPNPQVSYHEDLYGDPILSKFIRSDEFIKEYIKYAEILSQPNYIDSIIDTKKEDFNLLLSKIHRQNPFYIFPIDVLHENQKYIRNILFPYPDSPRIDVYFNELKNDSIFLSVENKIDIPIEIQNITYHNKIIGNQIFNLESNFRNSNKKIKIGIPLPSQIDQSTFLSDSLEVYYNLVGLNKMEKAIVFPKLITDKDYTDFIPTKLNSNIKEFDFIKANETDKTILFTGQNCNIQKDLIIPDGYIVSAEPGCIINLTNSARIISYSPMLFFGNSDDPITISSSDSTGQGIVVFNTERASELSYVNFNSLSNISDSGWFLDGAITFYESSVTINNCNFKSNIKGENYLNIIRTDFNILNTNFENIYADAFKAEFSNGKIENVSFDQIGRVAVNSRGSNIHLSKIDLTNLLGYGISGLQNSHLICENITIKGGKISVKSADNSNIEINEIKIESSDIAFCAFQEKPGYGPSKIVARNTIINNVKSKFLIETGSSLVLNGGIIDEKQNSVKEKLNAN